jgi:hypothetical protein
LWQPQVSRNDANALAGASGLTRDSFAVSLVEASTPK